jgi:hypothetical protein
VLANKVVDKDQLNTALEEVLKMGNVILETVEEYGIKKGEEKNRMEIVKKMLAENCDPLDIIRYTGISVEQLHEMREAVRSKAV